MATPITLTEFHDRLDQISAELGVVELDSSPGRLAEFCRLTGHDFKICLQQDLMPAGHFVTFADPLASQLILAFFVKLPQIIKGVIHTNSRVDYWKPLTISGGPYRERVRVDKVVEKTGSKGRYFVTDFEVEVLDPTGEKVAADLHQFFLKV